MTLSHISEEEYLLSPCVMTRKLTFEEVMKPSHCVLLRGQNVVEPDK